MASSQVLANCKACTKSLSSAANYCPHCGAQQIRERLTIWALFKSLVTRLLNLDFPFYKTSKCLLFSPEQVTLGYIQGVRKRITAPIQYAIIVISLYGLFQFFFSDFLNIILDKGFFSTLQEGFQNYENGDVQNYEQMSKVFNWLQSRNQFFFFSMIPGISLLSALFYKRTGYNLAEYIVLSTYAVSFASLLSVFLGLLIAPFSSEGAATIYLNTSLILSILFTAWIFKRSLKGSFLKPIGILILAATATFVLLLMALLIWVA